MAAEKIRANKAKRKAQSHISFKRAAEIAAQLAVNGEIPAGALAVE